MLTLEEIYSVIYGDIGGTPFSVPAIPWGSHASLPPIRVHTTIISGVAQRISLDGGRRQSGMLVLSVVAPDEVAMVRVASELMQRYQDRRVGTIKFSTPSFQSLGPSDKSIRGDVRVPFEESV